MTAVRRAVAVLLIVLATATTMASAQAGGPAPASGPGLRIIYRSYYDAEILGYCGFGGAAAVAGHRREVSDAVADYGVPRAALEQTRMRAWADAYREWQNRGLGGFRAWCATEGARAQQRLDAYGGGE